MRTTTDTKSGPRTVALDSIVWREPSRPIDKDHVKELAASIEEVGLLHRIGVVDLGDGKYEGRYGRHRYEAHRLLGRKEVDVEVLDLDGVGKELATIHENTKHLDMNPVQRARTFRRYAELRKAQDAKLTQEAIAGELQVSGPEFSNTVLLLDQEVHVQKLVEDGQLAPGHIEHAVAPLRSELVKLAASYGIPEKTAMKQADEITVKFAHDAARDRLDVRSAQEEAKDVLARAKGILDRSRLEEFVKAAKVKKCPGCRSDSYGSAEPRAFAEIQGRVVLQDRYGNHRWFADTGEFYVTPAEKKELEREQAEAARSRAAEARRHRVKREKTVRDYAAFFSRAAIAGWAQALLDASKADLGNLSIGDSRAGGSVALGYGRGLKISGFPDMLRQEYGGKLAVFLRSVDVPDGKGGKFATRVQVGEFRSTPGEQDNVVEGAAVTRIRKAREDLLAWQAKRIGVKQDPKDLWPVELGGFKLGEKVRIFAGRWASYVGKQGPVLALDVADGGKSPIAVLDMAAAHKVHELAALSHLEPKKGKAKKTPKGRGK